MSALAFPRGPRARAALAMLGIMALACCRAVPAPPPATTPPPPPPPAPVPATPPPPAPPAAPALSWDVAPVADGAWRLAREGADSVARFGPAGGGDLLAIRCLAASRSIELALATPGTGAGTMTIRTSAGTIAWPGAASADEGLGGQLVATRPAGDQGFDWIVYSRGRIALEAAGTPRLVVPVWAEIARVVEDCRG